MILCFHENQICVRHVDGRLRVWRGGGERHEEATVQPRDAYNGGSIMVWVRITAGRRTDRIVIPGILNGNDILMKFCILMCCLF